MNWRAAIGRTWIVGKNAAPHIRDGQGRQGYAGRPAPPLAERPPRAHCRRAFGSVRLMRALLPGLLIALAPAPPALAGDENFARVVSAVSLHFDGRSDGDPDRAVLAE